MNKIKSGYALLDVTKGFSLLPQTYQPETSRPTEVLIKGLVTYRHGSYDGTSREYVVNVKSVEIIEPRQDKCAFGACTRDSTKSSLYCIYHACPVPNCRKVRDGRLVRCEDHLDISIKISKRTECRIAEGCAFCGDSPE